MSALSLHGAQASNLFKRVASSLVLAPLALAAVYYGGIVFALVIALIVAGGLYEWLRLINPKLQVSVVVWAHLSLLAIMFLTVWHSVPMGFYALILLTVILFLVTLAASNLLTSRPTMPMALEVAFGLPYMGGAGLALLFLRGLPHSGMALVVYLLAVVWATDIGAYAAGRAIGGAKILPAVSPNKTWAGLIGGMVLAMLVGYGVALAGRSYLGFQGPVQAGGFAVLIAIVAQAGDFFKSFFKRRAGVKDSGHLIPGHGGILDRIDGLVFAAMFLAAVEFWA